MANWKLTLDVSEPWKKASSDVISPNEFCAQIIPLLKRLLTKVKLFNNLEEEANELEDIIEAFEDEAKDESLTKDAFDSLWNELYDWADHEVSPYSEFPKNRLCWVNTF